MLFDQISAPQDAAAGGHWPFSVPSVQSLCGDGIRLSNPISIIVGDNGSGKSTLIEALADSYGLDSRGGHGNRKYSTTNETSALGAQLELRLGGFPASASKLHPGFFLRSETALGVLSFMSDFNVAGYGDSHLGEVSHGESFLQVFAERFGKPGLFLMDEPEAGLSYAASLSLIGSMLETASVGGQVVCATHSPIIAATPGAEMWLASDDGLQRTSWDQLEMVRDWRRFMADPDSITRHLK
jgi:predicted ATPase